MHKMNSTVLIRSCTVKKIFQKIVFFSKKKLSYFFRTFSRTCFRTFFCTFFCHVKKIIHIFLQKHNFKKNFLPRFFGTHLYFFILS